MSPATNLISHAEQLAQELRAQKRLVDAETIDALLFLIHKLGHYLTVPEASQRLAIPEAMTLQWINQGLIPAVKWQQTWLIPATAFDKFAQLEQILDDMDAERELPSVAEIVETVEQERTHWTWQNH